VSINADWLAAKMVKASSNDFDSNVTMLDNCNVGKVIGASALAIRGTAVCK